MDFGVAMFPTDYSIGVVELGKALEDLGFESLWLPEHTHIPTSRLSPWAGGGELPKHYSHSADPFACTGAVAAPTSRLKLATAICPVIDPAAVGVAQEIA